jgi:hypothetical protein
MRAVLIAPAFALLLLGPPAAEARGGHAGHGHAHGTLHYAKGLHKKRQPPIDAAVVPTGTEAPRPDPAAGPSGVASPHRQ